MFDCDSDKLIITVPNAFSLENLFFTLSKKECINSDHRYWFSPYTIAKICTLAEIEIEEYHFCSHSPNINLNIILKKFYKLYPNTLSSIFLMGKL